MGAKKKPTTPAKAGADERQGMAPNNFPQTPKVQSANPNTALNSIMTLVATVNELHRQMAAICAPIVHELILTRSQDVQKIEETLDRLLGSACIPEGLRLFKSLCRYYYDLNPAATATYVHAYREMWDSEMSVEQEPPA